MACSHQTGGLSESCSDVWIGSFPFPAKELKGNGVSPTKPWEKEFEKEEPSLRLTGRT